MSWIVYIVWYSYWIVLILAYFGWYFYWLVINNALKLQKPLLSWPADLKRSQCGQVTIIKDGGKDDDHNGDRYGPHGHQHQLSCIPVHRIMRGCFVLVLIVCFCYFVYLPFRILVIFCISVKCIILAAL